MKNLSISKKLIAGFGSILGLMLLSIMMSIFSISSVGRQTENFALKTVPNVSDTWEMRRDLVSAERYVACAFLSKDIAGVKEAMASAAANAGNIQTVLDRYAANQSDDAVQEKIKAFGIVLSETGAVRSQIAELLTEGTERSIAEAKKLFSTDYAALFDQAASIIVEMSDIELVRADAQEAAAERAESTARLVLIALSIVSLAAAFLIIGAIRRSVLTPVTEIVGVYEEISRGNMGTQIHYESRDELGRMAKLIQQSNEMQGGILGDTMEKFTKISQGDLQLTVDLDYPGDFAALKTTIENTVSTLNETMQAINMAAEQVSIGAAQVSDGAQALAAGSTEQASSLEELNAAIIQIAEQAEETADVVRTATASVELAGAGVTAGNEHMHDLTAAMTEIDASSKQIANITKVIEDIAFQTNILALNAAIEAARAGNAGKGFAVVADEVRSLAGKSAEAAKQTAELIQNSVSAVAKGSNITAQTAQILQQVGTSAANVTDSFTKIEQATAEQADAIDQIKFGLTQVASVVQTNAATAEENSATSEEMSAQAAALRAEVGRFKLASGKRA
jgi:methyl-accepting chemotaxis protein